MTVYNKCMSQVMKITLVICIIDADEASTNTEKTVADQSSLLTSGERTVSSTNEEYHSINYDAGPSSTGKLYPFPLVVVLCI